MQWLLKSRWESGFSRWWMCNSKEHFSWGCQVWHTSTWLLFPSSCDEVTFPALLLGRNWLGRVQGLRLASVSQSAHSACWVGAGRGHDPGAGAAVADVHVALLVSGRVWWFQLLLIQLPRDERLGSSFLPCLFWNTGRLSKCQGCWWFGCDGSEF